jgi:hypothetical protein
MQSQRRHKEQEHDHDPDLQKEKKNDSSEFFLINLEQMNHPRCPGIPKRVGENEEKKNEDNADDKRAEEEVPKENDFLALHVPTAGDHFRPLKANIFPFRPSPVTP